MTYKIAVASSDGRVVNQHFAAATHFAIFEIGEGGDYRFVELREALPIRTGISRNGQGLEYMAEVIRDCQAVLVSWVGPGTVRVLRSKGIEAAEIPHYIPEAIMAYVNAVGRKHQKARADR
ncbi:hypothetical protein SY88_19150 [Clostridiales bacterium PH28_bin88]|nr:hypothetical protein SY88_19150 [Clostridiales bacterium PH28_bin88]